MGGIKNFFNSPERRIARGEGRMVDGQFVEYTAADKAHIQDANANRNAAFTDISVNSGLGRNWGDGGETLLGNSRKKKQTAAGATLLGMVAGGKQTLGG